MGGAGVGNKLIRFIADLTDDYFCYFCLGIKLNVYKVLNAVDQGKQFKGNF